MPRHNPENTPPEKRRAAKGTAVARMSGRHTAESLSALEALKARWCCNEAEAMRRALEYAARHASDTTP